VKEYDLLVPLGGRVAGVERSSPPADCRQILMRSPRHQHRRNYNDPGHAHELTFSCYQGFKFLASDRSCGWLADSIERARCRFEFDLWAYVFMPEHAHLVVHPRKPEYDIAEIRKAIRGPVGKRAIQFLQAQAPEWVPRITRRRGSKTERLFWQSGGGYDRNVTDGKTLLEMIDYIHLNPVRRGLVEQAGQWKWSSAAWFLGGRQPPLIPDQIPPEWCQ
jgi:putative transposase